jgi:hypothetical protein
MKIKGERKTETEENKYGEEKEESKTERKENK